MSKFFKTQNSLTDMLRDLTTNESLLLEKSDDVSFSRAMKNVTAIANRLNISIKQTAFRGIGKYDDSITNAIKITKI